MSDRPPNPFATSFLEAAPYLMRARGEHFVLWLDEAIDADVEPELAEEIAILHTLGVQLTLVVGGSPEQPRPIDAEAQRAADVHAMQRLRRWQDLLSRGWVGIAEQRYRLTVVSGNMVTGRRLGIVRGQDYGHLGVVRSVDAARIGELQQRGVVLIFGGGLSGATGLPLWVPPLVLATELARRTRAHKLVCLTPTRLNDQLPAEWALSELDRRAGQVEGLPAAILGAAGDALRGGVPRVHVVDPAEHGTVLAELFSRRGSGLLLTESPTAAVGPVAPEEVSELVALLSRFEPAGTLRARSRELIEANLEGFRVLKVDGRIIACGALKRFDDAPDAMLVESVAVHPDYQGEGRGGTLLRALEEEAEETATSLYAYTTGAEDWFQGYGYQRLPVEQAPAAVQRELKPERGSVLLKRDLDQSERPVD